MNILEFLIDAAAHSGHDVLIRCYIGAKPVEGHELECLIWRIAIREHTFKVEEILKQRF
jgi:hypothetical protein